MRHMCRHVDGVDEKYIYAHICLHFLALKVSKCRHYKVCVYTSTRLHLLYEASCQAVLSCRHLLSTYERKAVHDNTK